MYPTPTNMLKRTPLKGELCRDSVSFIRTTFHDFIHDINHLGVFGLKVKASFDDDHSTRTTFHA